MLIILVGNKSDLGDKRQVQKEEAEAFARKNDLIFFETSAKTSAGVEETFTTAAKTIYQGIQEDKYDTEGEAIGIKAGNMQVQKSGRYANLQAGEKQKKDDGCCWWFAHLLLSLMLVTLFCADKNEFFFFVC